MLISDHFWIHILGGNDSPLPVSPEIEMFEFLNNYIQFLRLLENIVSFSSVFTYS